MPLTQEQIVEAIRALNLMDIPRRRALQALQLAILKYEVEDGQVKTLPEEDRVALLERYRKLKAELKTQLETLP
jgi:hypothetical protein